MYVMDALARGIDFDKEEFHKRLRFCPSCGTRNLHRHVRTHDAHNKPLQGRELWCSLCGFSFRANTSLEWNCAIRLFKEHRKLRTNRRFQEGEFDADVVREWKKINFKPDASTTWPARRGFSLADKLKAALNL